MPNVLHIFVHNNGKNSNFWTNFVTFDRQSLSKCQPFRLDRWNVGRVVHKRDCIIGIMLSRLTGLIDTWQHLPSVTSSDSTVSSFPIMWCVGGVIATNAKHCQMTDGIKLTAMVFRRPWNESYNAVSCRGYNEPSLPESATAFVTLQTCRFVSSRLWCLRPFVPSPAGARRLQSQVENVMPDEVVQNPASCLSGGGVRETPSNRLVDGIEAGDRGQFW